MFAQNSNNHTGLIMQITVMAIFALHQHTRAHTATPYLVFRIVSVRCNCYLASLCSVSNANVFDLIEFETITDFDAELCKMLEATFIPISRRSDA